MIGSSRSYAIGMAHFQIAGGFKSLIIVITVYLAIFFGGLGLYLYADRLSTFPSGLSSVLVSLLLAFEAFVLIIVGSFRVASAIRMDISTRMIESHRLMPVPSWRAVMGYLLGATTHVVAFALTNVLLAYLMAGWTHTPLTDLTLNQAMIFSICFGLPRVCKVQAGPRARLA